MEREGTYRHPGDFKTLTSMLIVCSRIFGGVMSILVTQIATGTFKAMATPKCSYLVSNNSL